MPSSSILAKRAPRLLSSIKTLSRVRLQRGIYKVNFQVTSACNLLCKTCNIGRGFRSNPRAVEGELSLDEVGRIFSSHGGLLWIGITGGEPFMRPDLVKLVKVLREEQKGLRILSIVTNGSSPSLIRRSVKEIMELGIPHIFVSVSIDGPKEVHERIRGVGSSYERCLLTLQGLYELAQEGSNLYPGVEHTISSFNLGSLESLLKVNPLVVKGDMTVNLFQRGAIYDNLEGDDGDLDRRFKNFDISIDGISPRGLSRGVFRSIYLRLAKEYLETGVAPIPCEALKGSVFLNPYGEVKPCCMWGVSVGSLREVDYSLPKVLSSAEAMRARDTIRMRSCPGCWTPCEAYQSILKQSPWDILRRFVRYSYGCRS